MSRRTGWVATPDRSRESLLRAWLERHDLEIRQLGARAKGLVERRLKTLVADTAGLFPDIDRSVHMSGDKDKVGWTSEPGSLTGVEDFENLLDRVGPLAMTLVSRGLALLKDENLRADLIGRGLQPGWQRGELNWVLARELGGEKLLTRLGEEMSAAIATQAPRDASRLLALADDEAIAELAVAAFLRSAEQSAGVRAELAAEDAEFDSDSVLQRSRSLCEQECGVTTWELVTPLEYEEALKKLADRWDGRGQSARRRALEIDLSPATRIRFAHTLIHPHYYEFVHEVDGAGSTGSDEFPTGESWKEILVWFRTAGADRIQRGVRYRRLQTQDARMLLSENYDENFKRLLRTFRDAYVDPARMPEDWPTELIGLTIVRGLGDKDKRTALRRQNDDGSENERADEKRPWEPRYEERDEDATARAYWRDRDVHLTETPEFLDFVLHPRHQRQPYVLIDFIVFFAAALVRDADLEVFGRDEPISKEQREAMVIQRVQRRARAKNWIEEKLSATLLEAYRRIPNTRKVQRERADLGLLYSSLDFVALCGADAGCDNVNERILMRQVGRVVQNATVRAAILAIGRKAREYQEDMADE